MDNKAYYKKNKKRINLASSKWFKAHPHYIRDRLRNNPEERKKHAEYYRKWYKKNGRKRTIHYQVVIEKWRKEHPESVIARIILKKALLKKVIKKSNQCEFCKRKNIKINGHHEDYNKPLKVIWLCSSCHKKLHYMLKQFIC